jgi:pilus assembly protein CpaB
MRAKTILIALVALLIAGGTGMLIKTWLRVQNDRMLANLVQPAQPKETGIKILVAAKKLPTGTLLTPSHMKWRLWPEDGLSKEYVVQNKRKKAEFVGAVVRAGISASEPIIDGRVVKPGDRGFMAAVLTPGMRAVSVQVNRITGISGFVFPGDRVDLIVTHKVRRESAGARKLQQVSETVLAGLRVLAVDQTTNDQDSKPKVAKTATLEVTPRQAEMIAVAAQLGKLSLSLRSLTVDEAKGIAETPTGPAKRGKTYTRDSDISALIRRSGRKEVTVLRGTTAKDAGSP